MCSDDGHDTADHGTFVDDRSGKQLPVQLVRAARKKEIKTMEDMAVYKKVPKHVAVRWLDIDKAEPGKKLDIRSRCVAREFASETRDDLFAGTPALEAIKMMCRGSG